MTAGACDSCPERAGGRPGDRPSAGCSRRVASVVSWGCLALVGALAASAAWLGVVESHHPPLLATPTIPTRLVAACHPPFTGFGGYSARRSTHAISAMWTVPTIERGEGYAATWVGLQQRTNAFLQIGTNENHLPTLRYYAFWSDTALGFRPRSLFDVRPGDVVRAGISRAPEGWRLRFDDVTAGRARTFVTPYARSAHFDEAEWLQEDPSTGCTDFPYPTTSTVTFSQLQLNGSEARLPLTDAQVLESPNGSVLVPSHLRDGVFSLVAPTGAAAQYLDDTEPFNTTQQRFLNAAAGANRARRSGAPGVSTAILRVESRHGAERFLHQVDELRRDLRSQVWPRAAARAVRDLAAADGHLRSELVKVIARFEQDGTWTLRHWTTGHHASTRAADALRHVLGLPPTAPRT
jgi:hypothetical protein